MKPALKTNRVRAALRASAGILLGSLLGSLFLLACSPPTPIPIGFVGGISGRGADLGIAARDAVQLAVELRNRAGGVAGHEVKLLIRDDQQNTATAQGVTRELIDQGVVAIVGPVTSTVAKAILPIVDDARVVMVSSSATTDELTGKDDYLYRVNMSTAEAATRIAEYHLKERPLGPLVAAYDLNNRSYTERWLEAFRTTYEKGGGEVRGAIGFESSSETAFVQVARNLLATPADGVLIVANSMDTALLCQQIRKAGSRLPIIVSGWAGTERLLELGGRAVEGVMVAQNFDRESKAPAYQAFRQAYRERFRREPGFSGTMAFDAANIVMEALAQQPDPRKLKATLQSVRRFQGVQEPILFDEFGDVIREIHMTVVRDGQFIVIR
ncbi:ABC transporter substrate-binding protein [Candidatus Accumulibacter vicinus]|uniref:Leucine-, isoleucine-, valine-, threonine-, and alanine-binding protein n=1 Tax=Candidatus Accumulibacter vicinus TaxID=2954382 RepID=A0A084Y521_9PROT|nr:ABC transporter substrate-binding protein [Candidatus Accumulibacter vicinus]KFB69815.1 MAG: Leucine-, isoleucine-, valine-, threonine-, and alanine-binding protein precursor [Candidatus Accumulibacter vicinus]